MASEILARSEENQTSCYPNLSNSELVNSFEILEIEIGLLTRLKNLRIAATQTDIIKQNIILVNDEKTKELTIYSFESLPSAQMKYFQLEKESGESMDIVLVRAPSQESLRQAYRNYFSDTRDFTRLIEAGTKSLLSS